MPTSGASTSRPSNSASTEASVTGALWLMWRCPGAAGARRRDHVGGSICMLPGGIACRRPSAVTLRTRPPAVTTSPPRSAVPAWVTSTSSGTRSSPWMTSPDDEDTGYPREASTTVTAARGVPLERGAGQAARPGRALQQVEQVRAQPRQHGLRLRIAEADVELEHLRARRR